LVGFPGEADADFEQTVSLLEGLPVSFYHVFRYSPRPGTEAAGRPGQVAPEVAARRARRLLALGRSRREEFLRTHLGHPAEGIVEQGADPVGRRPVLLDDYATVWVPVSAAWRRRRVRVQVLRVDERGRLIGEVLASAPASGAAAGRGERRG
jgi:threonylcarbamoyladenosine tRNA methylthiotransferase MtaB